MAARKRVDPRERERERGRHWFRSLDRGAKGDLGDDFVLGMFDWTDWFDTKPSAAFLAGAEEERLYWEETS